MAKIRSRVNRKADKKYFAKTAARTRSINVPGKVVARGGVRL